MLDVCPRHHREASIELCASLAHKGQLTCLLDLKLLEKKKSDACVISTTVLGAQGRVTDSMDPQIFQSPDCSAVRPQGSDFTSLNLLLICTSQFVEGQK
jgi:hypothetical protein